MCVCVCVYIYIYKDNMPRKEVKAGGIGHAQFILTQTGAAGKI